jgi:hypothetical protein
MRVKISAPVGFFLGKRARRKQDLDTAINAEMDRIYGLIDEHFIGFETSIRK